MECVGKQLSISSFNRSAVTLIFSQGQVSCFTMNEIQHSLPFTVCLFWSSSNPEGKICFAIAATWKRPYTVGQSHSVMASYSSHSWS